MNNDIVDLPPEIGSMTGLLVLDASHNRISGINRFFS